MQKRPIDIAKCDRLLHEKLRDLITMVETQQEQLLKYEDVIASMQQRIDNLEEINNQKRVNYKDFDYEAFEEHFRGSKEIVKKKLSQYVKFFLDRDNVLDIGCGRGEFLEILKENQVTAEGVDLFLPFVEQCQKQGLNVQYGDGVEYLKSKEKWGGIFASQVIEHLEIGKLIELCKEAYNRLEQGAYIVLETPNPTKLDTYTNSFYVDPTHIKPIHPATIKFIFEQIGFKECGLIFTEESKYTYNIPMLKSDAIENLEEFNYAMAVLNDFLFGSMDYAVYGRK